MFLASGILIARFMRFGGKRGRPCLFFNNLAEAARGTDRGEARWKERERMTQGSDAR